MKERERERGAKMMNRKGYTKDREEKNIGIL